MGHWGSFLEIRNFWPEYLIILDIRLYVKLWRENYFSTSNGPEKVTKGNF